MTTKPLVEVLFWGIPYVVSLSYYINCVKTSWTNSIIVAFKDFQNWTGLKNYAVLPVNW